MSLALEGEARGLVVHGMEGFDYEKAKTALEIPDNYTVNAMAAVAMVKAVGLSDAVIRKGLKTFKGVPHRIERIGEKGGVPFYNDSKGTNVDSTLVALKALPKPILLILGGQHKGSSYQPLIPLIKKKVKLILTIGEAAPIIERDLKGAAPIESRGDIDGAMAAAWGAARGGASVLLSPACASFDQYRNYEERGRHFVRLFKGLVPKARKT